MRDLWSGEALSLLHYRAFYSAFWTALVHQAAVSRQDLTGTLKIGKHHGDLQNALVAGQPPTKPEGRIAPFIWASHESTRQD